MQLTLTLTLDSADLDRRHYARTLRYIFGFVAGQIDALTDHGRHMEQLAHAGAVIETEDGELIGRWHSERPDGPRHDLHSVPQPDPPPGPGRGPGRLMNW